MALIHILKLIWNSPLATGFMPPLSNTNRYCRACLESKKVYLLNTVFKGTLWEKRKTIFKCLPQLVGHTRSGLEILIITGTGYSLIIMASRPKASSRIEYEISRNRDEANWKKVAELAEQLNQRSSGFGKIIISII